MLTIIAVVLIPLIAMQLLGIWLPRLSRTFLFQIIQGTLAVCLGYAVIYAIALALGWAS